MSKPNFFIIGAPKCGTTALSDYLRDHRNVFMSTPKEPHFFATDLPNYRLTSNQEDYQNLFKDSNHDHKVIGEASVWYLYSKQAIKNIFEFNRDAKLIVMLRNPVELTYSMHSQALASLDESVKDFSRAWDLSLSRKNGANVPKNCRDRQILYYDEIAKLGDQLERTLKIFPSEQLHIIFFDDFIQDTKQVYQSVLNYLELDDDGKTQFPVINKNEKLKSAPLYSMIRKLPTSLTSKYLAIKRMTGFKGLKIVNKINDWNLKESERKELDYQMKERIIEKYEQDIKKLGALTGRDLSAWTER